MRSGSFIAGLLLGLFWGAVATIGLFVYLNGQTPLESEISSFVNAAPKRIDFSKLLKGEWRALCVFGAYENPRAGLRAFAARHQLTLGPDRESVPSDEMLSDGRSSVAVVTESEVRWATNIRSAIIVTGEHGCILRNQPVMDMPGQYR